MPLPFCRPYRLAVALFALAAASLQPAAAVPVSYGVDQRSGSIEFQVRSLGLLPVHGHFSRYMGQLSLDPQDPARTRIDVEIDAGQIESPWPGVAPRLRSVAYFDAENFPRITFRSTSVTPGTDRHFTLNGILSIRGIERPLLLDVAAMRIAGGTVADVVATGVLNRSEFGMLADPGLVSDRVRLTITWRIQLPPGAPAPT
ncbi:MAG TPA: YceI family protein [Roseomonas sp.]|jgi:polyisoprenoid-binding protein YceI